MCIYIYILIFTKHDLNNDDDGDDFGCFYGSGLSSGAVAGFAAWLRQWEWQNTGENRERASNSTCFSPVVKMLLQLHHVYVFQTCADHPGNQQIPKKEVHVGHEMVAVVTPVGLGETHGHFGWMFRHVQRHQGYGSQIRLRTQCGHLGKGHSCFFSLVQTSRRHLGMMIKSWNIIQTSLKNQAKHLTTLRYLVVVLSQRSC